MICSSFRFVRFSKRKDDPVNEIVWDTIALVNVNILVEEIAILYPKPVSDETMDAILITVLQFRA